MRYDKWVKKQPKCSTIAELKDRMKFSEEVTEKDLDDYLRFLQTDEGMSELNAVRTVLADVSWWPDGCKPG